VDNVLLLFPIRLLPLPPPLPPPPPPLNPPPPPPPPPSSSSHQLAELKDATLLTADRHLKSLTGSLFIKIHRGADLRAVDSNGFSDPYVKVYIEGLHIYLGFFLFFFIY